MVTETYELMSAESVLVQRYVSASGRQTLTVIHPDGDALVLTHYCAQGNQARLRSTSGGVSHVVFDFADATNRLPTQAILIRCELAVGEHTFTQSDTYQQPDGTTETTVLEFHRVGQTQP